MRNRAAAIMFVPCIVVSLVAGCTCGSTTPEGAAAPERSSLAERVAELEAEGAFAEEVVEGDEEDTDTAVHWPTGPRPRVPPLTPPTLALAGGEQCKIEGPHLIGEHPRPADRWRGNVEIGFGADGGLVAYTFGQTTAYLRPVDATGAPRGDAMPFRQDIEVLFHNILAYSGGFLLLGSKLFEYDYQLLWVTDRAGRRPAARTKLPLGTTGILSWSDVVGDRLLIAGRDKWGVRVVLAEIDADGTVAFPVDIEHLVVDVMQQAISAEVALDDQHGVVLFVQQDLRDEDGRVHEYLFVDGEQRELAGEVPVPGILLHDYQTHRLAWHEGQLHILSGVDEPDDADAPLIMIDPAGERVIEQGISPAVKIRYGKLERNWFNHGPPIEQPALAELEPPFVQRVVLEVGTDSASRMTQLGLVGVGEPASLAALDPPIADAGYAEWAWSGERFVVAYPAARGDRVGVYTFALDCRK